MNVTKERGFCGASGVDCGDRRGALVMLAELHTVNARMDTKSSVYGAVSHSTGTVYHAFDTIYKLIHFTTQFK